VGHWGGPFSCLPDLVADCCEVGNQVFSSYGTSSAGRLSVPADYTTLSVLICQCSLYILTRSDVVHLFGGLRTTGNLVTLGLL